MTDEPALCGLVFTIRSTEFGWRKSRHFASSDAELWLLYGTVKISSSSLNLEEVYSNPDAVNLMAIVGISEFFFLKSN